MYMSILKLAFINYSRYFKKTLMQWEQLIKGLAQKLIRNIGSE